MLLWLHICYRHLTSYSCENWSLYILRITYDHMYICICNHENNDMVCAVDHLNDHLYSALCLASWALSGSLVPEMWNRTSCVQLHELPQSHCADHRKGTLYSWFHIYFVHLTSGRFGYSVCRGSLKY